MIYVLAGKPEQFTNFCHAFGPHFSEVVTVEQLQSHRRVVVLLVGTWHDNPLRDAVLNYCQSKDRDGRPRGQAFAMFGSRNK